MMAARTIDEDKGFENAPAAQTGEGEILHLVAVHIGDEIYALDIGRINSIIMPQAVTRVPRTPEYVVGVINLRGHIVPIVDLRKRFGLPPIPAVKSTHQRIVIVEVDGITAGLMVDAVSEVLRMPAERIEPPSLLVVTADAECITGIGRADDQRLLILLDVYKTLTMKPSEEAVLRRLGQAPVPADGGQERRAA